MARARRAAPLQERIRAFLRRRAGGLLTGGGWWGQGQGLMQGGLVNTQTGMGLAGSDKNEASFFTPTRLHSRHELETLYVQSWAAAHYIDIPVDDMLIRWREFESGENEAAAEAMSEVERRHRVQSRLAAAMKAGRLYGTGLLVMVTREANLQVPLMPERIREGDLVGLLVFDRYEASVMARDEDVYSPTFGEPLTYRLQPRYGTAGLDVHATRVLRFDGCSPLSSGGYQTYDRDWGVSLIVPAILAIMQDQTAATGAAHLTQEASIPVLHVDGFREALAGTGMDPDDPTPEQLGERINQLKSVYRTLMMDKTDEFERVAVTWSGLPDIMDRFARRLAASAQIPATRFWGMSPVGMNATGESDMVNYSAMVAAEQHRLLDDPMKRLDAVLARDAGLAEAPEYEWMELTSLSDLEQAQVSKTRIEALAAAVTAGVIDEDEARLALDGDPVFGALPGPAPELPDPEPMPGMGPMGPAAGEMEP